MEIILKKDGVTALADTHGAELHSYLLATGREVLWGGSAESWKGRSPVLFPIVGTLAKNQTTIGGKCYSMKSHGFARNLEFEVAQQTESSVTFVLRADNETRAQYPFE
ncbi:MAG: aldose 1-epimerase family protein, partial [Pygmaiobacter sp.]